MQYTLRSIPPAVDRALRQKARREGRSLNDVAVAALARGIGVANEPVRHRDLPTNDMWIAALVLQHDLTLFDRDRHFDHLPQIRRA